MSKWALGRFDCSRNESETKRAKTIELRRDLVLVSAVGR